MVSGGIPFHGLRRGSMLTDNAATNSGCTRWNLEWRNPGGVACPHADCSGT